MKWSDSFSTTSNHRPWQKASTRSSRSRASEEQCNETLSRFPLLCPSAALGAERDDKGLETVRSELPLELPRGNAIRGATHAHSIESPIPGKLIDDDNVVLLLQPVNKSCSGVRLLKSSDLDSEQRTT